MKAKVTKVAVISGQPTFQHTLHLMATVSDTPKGTADISLTATKASGYRQPATKVELKKDWQTKPWLATLGIKNTDAVTGLRTAALKAAEAHWASFIPTTDELTAAPVHIGLRVEKRRFKDVTIHADLTALPFAGYQFWGVCDYTVDAAGRISPATGTDASRLFTEDPLMVLDAGQKGGRQNNWGVIFTKEWADMEKRDIVSSEVCQQITDAIMPAVQELAGRVVKTISSIHIHAQTEAVEQASKAVMNDLWAVAHRLKAYREEQAKLKALLPDYTPSQQFIDVEAMIKTLGLEVKEEQQTGSL